MSYVKVYEQMVKNGPYNKRSYSEIVLTISIKIGYNNFEANLYFDRKLRVLIL